MLGGPYEVLKKSLEIEVKGALGGLEKKTIKIHFERIEKKLYNFMLTSLQEAQKMPRKILGNFWL